jgi:hypothetical protein
MNSIQEFLMSSQANLPHLIPRYYQIVVEGKIDPSWSGWLGGVQLSATKDVAGLDVTILEGSIQDQAALRGILNHLWDLNLSLRTVRQINPISESNQEVFR